MFFKCNTFLNIKNKILQFILWDDENKKSPNWELLMKVDLEWIVQMPRL